MAVGRWGKATVNEDGGPQRAIKRHDTGLAYLSIARRDEDKHRTKVDAYLPPKVAIIESEPLTGGN